MAKLQLRILTSETIKVDEPVDMIVMRCVMDIMGKRTSVGDLGILPNHVPLSAVIGISPLRILNEGTDRMIAVFGGVVEVKDNVVMIMTEKAMWPEEIDQERARAEKKKAEEAREAIKDDIDLRSNQIAMRRALVQIEVSSYPLIGRK